MNEYGAIATGHPETSGAAAIILRQGGNAFDAALGAMLAACITEPVLNSLGGGGFLLASPSEGKPVLYDFFAQTPRQRREERDSDFHSAKCNFGTVEQEFHIGMASLATPGVAKGLFEVHADLGKMPLKQIIEPALRLARLGIKINPLQAYIFDVVKNIFLSSGPSCQLYASRADSASTLKEGEIFTNPAFADTLEVLIEEGESLFYRGEIAAKISQDCREGGNLTREDFAGYQLKRREPLTVNYAGARILSNPPPSTGGILVAFALHLLEKNGLDPSQNGSIEHLGLLTRAMAQTNKARIDSQLHELSGHLAMNALFDPQFIDLYRNKVLGRPQSLNGTTHISVIDASGNAVSLTLSNGEGAGYIVPGTGIMMNNMLGEEDINPHGFHKWPVDTRMASMMAPTMVFPQDGRHVALGSGGSNRIRTAILQTLVNLLDLGMPIEEAIYAPRLHYERGLLNIEPGFKPKALEVLLDEYPKNKLWGDRNMFFGGVHGVSYYPDTNHFEGAGDPRRGGSFQIVS